MAYYQVPADIIEDAESLVDWARKSVAVALTLSARRKRAPKKARRSRPKKKPAKARNRQRAARSALVTALHARLRGADEIRERFHRRRTRGAAAHIGASSRRRPSCRRWPRPARRDSRESKTPCDAARTACRARVARRRSSAVSRMITISGRIQIFGERFEQAHVAMRKAIDGEPGGAQRALAGLEPARLAEQVSGANQRARGDAVAGGDRIVAEALAAMDQRFVIVRREEEPAELRVLEVLEHGVEDLRAARRRPRCASGAAASRAAHWRDRRSRRDRR